MNQIETIYENKINFDIITNEEKLKLILFPFNEELKDEKIKRDINKKNELIEKRIKILNLLFDYCVYSGRFDELFNYKYEIKTW